MKMMIHGEFAEAFDNLNQMGLFMSKHFSNEFKKKVAHELKISELIAQTGKQTFRK